MFHALDSFWILTKGLLEEDKAVSQGKPVSRRLAPLHGHLLA